jgi:hypothetical protein
MQGCYYNIFVISVALIPLSLHYRYMIEKYLMDYDEYNTTRHTFPYSYSVSRDNQYLYYIGVHHSADPKNPMFDEIREFWQNFLAHTDKKNSIVFIEGGNWPMSESEEEAILKGGDPKFTKYIATRDGVETISPEPPEDEKFRQQLKNFTKEEIAYYEFARMVFQWNNLIEKPDLERYLSGLFRQLKIDTGWEEIDFSITGMAAIEKKMFNREFNKNDKQFYYDIINPTTVPFSRINELSRFEDSGYRDRHILQQIEKYWNEGKSIFIVYGGTHAVMHEPAIRKLVI